jgi:hypothetical protein
MTSCQSAMSATAQQMDGRAILYMSLLAIQFGTQPVLSRSFIPSTLPRSAVVLVQELIKFFLAAGLLYSSGDFASATKGAA